MSELKSCQCGEKPGLFSFFRKAFGIWKVRYFYVRCPVCKRRTHNAMSKEKAIEEWNRRVKMAEFELNTENQHRSNNDDVLFVKREDLIKDLPEVIVDAHGKRHTKNEFIEALKEG